MKKILLIMLVCLCTLVGKSQVTLEAGYKLSWYNSNVLRLYSREKQIEFVDVDKVARKSTYRTNISKERSQFSFLYQPRLYWRNLELRADTKIYFNCVSPVSYTPVHVDFALTLKFTMRPNLIISVSHLCSHPIMGDTNKFKNRELLRGGYNKLSVSYNIK